MKNEFVQIIMRLLLFFVFSSFAAAQTENEDKQTKTDLAVEEYFAQLNGQNGITQNSTILKEFIGKAADDRFGYDVANAGDVNGDGYDDIIVGAYWNDASAFNAGSAYIYFGGAIMDYIPDIVLTGEGSQDFFGISVATAGDVNADGYDDVIIGAYYNNENGSDAGKAYIFYGGIAMDNTADITMTGEAVSDHFGQPVSSAGDVNGDGFNDVIIGAFGNDEGGANAGKAYIFYGAIAMDNTADLTMTGEAAADNFGLSALSAGDLNGDGYADVIIGAKGNDDGGLNAGKAYIYYGGASMDNTVDVTMIGEASSDEFGISVSNAGDVNGDGYEDVIIGAQYNDDGGEQAGKTYIYFGGASMDNTADVTITGAAAADYFGSSVSKAGDVNGDGYGDIIVGAWGNDEGDNGAGKAYIYYGDEIMDNLADRTMLGEAAGDGFGISVSGAGDVNGDGYSDVIIGAYLNDDGGTNAGKAYLFMQTLRGQSNFADLGVIGEANFDQFGWGVSNAGDVNGDGYEDVIVGANGNDEGGSGAGKAYIYYGGTSMDNTADVTMIGETANNNFGFSVSSSGDVNGDGYSDVIIGANYNDDGGADAGKAYIYFGGVSMDNTADVTMIGEAAGDHFGVSVSSAGDVNGDGYEDVIVGANGNDEGGAAAGKAYIYFGGASMDNTADVTMIGEAVNDFFGVIVSNAGDVNSDGYSDVIIGAYGNDEGGTDAGKAYIYFGGSSMDNTVDVTMIGEASIDRFGQYVSNAGDVNGDGYSDVIIGAWGNDEGGAAAGKAYIYFGRASMDNTADVTMIGEAVNDFFGVIVSNAGDVNSDGYSDVIIGAYGNDEGGTDAGKAYIYFGGSSMDNTADVTMIGEAVGDFFGSSVSNAGDVNGDGYSDVIVSAFRNDDGGANAGKAYIYLSAALPVKPNIFSATDVPLDQGGYVKIKWSRCAYDNPSDNRIDKYIVHGSGPKINGNFTWQSIAEITPTYDAYYSFTAGTDYDSTSQSNAIFYYRVSALSANNGEIWKSDVKAAYSVDNISPSAAGQMIAQQVGNHSVQLAWQRNTIDEDLSHYTLHRSDTDGFTPDETTQIAATTDTFYVDTSPLDQQNTYYKVVTYDIHENPSTPSPQAAIFFDSSLPVFMSAFSAAIAGNGNVQISFSTASENEMIGFNIWRLTEPEASYTKIATYLEYDELLAQGSESAGADYVWLDAMVESNQTYYYKLQAMEINGSSEFIGPVSITVDYLPTEFALQQNFPNPFNPQTTIPYELPLSSDVEIIIYNTMGQKMQSYAYQNKAAGIYKQVISAYNLSSGMYFYSITARANEAGTERSFIKVRKMLLIK